VSLTKHGAHKIAALLNKYDKDEVLDHLSDSELGINIELAQAKKTLCASSKGLVPTIWNKARQRGSETVNALVLLGIIYSHHKLISVMRDSRGKRPYSGRIVRGKHISGKAYSNLANNIEELGYSTEHSRNHIDYDLHKIFQIPGLNKLAIELIGLKLETAGWNKKNSIADESIAHGLHEALSVSEAHFNKWLSTGAMGETNDSPEAPEVLDYFVNADDKELFEQFQFKSGHNPKKIGTVPVKPSKNESTADLVHNEIQTSLYAKLVHEYGKDNVGTEISTGQGTSIDIVVKTKTFCWFYEIKTADSVKACIRQALPQLLEYAYWHGNDDRADRLIIVSSLPITKGAETYLSFLREKFCLQVHYEQHQVTVKNR